MNEAIRLAIEKGGYEDESLKAVSYETTSESLHEFYSGTQELYLTHNPLFWQALGKALNWWPHNPTEKDLLVNSINPYTDGWLYYGRKYFDLLLTGGDTEKFWKEILNKQP